MGEGRGCMAANKSAYISHLEVGAIFLEMDFLLRENEINETEHPIHLHPFLGDRRF